MLEGGMTAPAILNSCHHEDGLKTLPRFIYLTNTSLVLICDALS